MRKPENIVKRGPLIWAQYEDKLDQLDIVFQFIFYAFNSLSKASKEKFVQKLKLAKASKQADNLNEIRDLSKSVGLKALFDAHPDIIADVEKVQKRELRAGFRSGTHTQYQELVTDGMVAAEILFRVAVFEDFMKHAHAVFLAANIRILSRANREKTATFGNIFESFDAFKNEQICNEVENLDRQNMEKRVDYFERHLGVSLAKYKGNLIEISHLRNTFAHNKPLEAITREDTTLTLTGITGKIAQIIRDTMKAVFEKGKADYPKHFRDK